MKAVRIGIVTMLYGTQNYGGCLQAYALMKYLNKANCKAEQILVDCTPIVCGSLNARIKQTLQSIYNRLIEFGATRNDVLIHKELSARRLVFKDFISNSIATSETVYTLSTIDDCVSHYDCFVTGSDQVWHPSAVNRAYLLEFVPDVLQKFSYAASVPIERIDSEYASRLKKSLASYDGISLREESTVQMVEEATGRRDIACCIDPVFLLTSSDWLENCPKRKYQEKYLLCYFLGDSEEQRKIAETYAKRQGLIVVTLPYLLGHERKCDRNFGQYKESSATPLELLSLIRFADFVMTDSFHASAFSILFNTQFIAFERRAKSTMNARIKQLLSMFDCSERFCPDDEHLTCEYINSIVISQNNELKYNGTAFEQKKRESVRFLESIIDSQ